MSFHRTKAIDATFRKFGVDAVLDPDLTARPVRLQKHKGDIDGGFEGLNIRRPGTVYQIRAEEFDGFGKGAVLEIGSERKQVKMSPEPLDSHGLVLLLDVQDA